MPYRDNRDALRERIAWLAEELDRARVEDRVAALERELTDARERLARLERTPADGVRRRVRVLAAVLAGAVVSLGVTVGVIAFLDARGEPVALAPPLPTSREPPMQLELDSPPGWTSTTDERWTELTSPDGEVRTLFTFTDATAGAYAVSARHEAWGRLCPSAAIEGTMQTREIGPDHLPALYDEVPCPGEGATLVVVDAQSYQVEVGPFGIVETSEATMAWNRVVLVSRLASDCPESRRLEMASMIASIRRKR